LSSACTSQNLNAPDNSDPNRRRNLQAGGPKRT
jgi:hypothetical protein